MINYQIAILLMMLGLLLMIISTSLIKKLIGMALFQTSALLFYISLGFIENASIPILTNTATIYTDPLPQVLMLTAIVVGVANLAVGLSLIIKIYKE